jgi:hypothetical protein
VEGKTFFDKEDVKKEARGILPGIPVPLLHSIMDEWVHRLKRWIEEAGDHLSSLS